MSNVDLVIEERAANIGNFLVDRQFDPIKGDDDEFISYPSVKR